MAVECINFKQSPSGALLGFADLFSDKWGLEIRSCPVFQKEGRKWIKLPCNEYQEDGEKKYFNFLRFREKSHLTEFIRQAVKAIESWCYENKITIDTEEDQDKTEESLPF